MVRYALFVMALIGSTTAWAACGGVSEHDAELRCEQERRAKGLLFTQAAYEECVDCYQQCGDDCVPEATTPYSYKCPE